MPAAAEAPALEDPEAAADPEVTDEESLLFPVLAFARFVGTTEEPCSSRENGGKVEGNALAGRFRCMLVGNSGRTLQDKARASMVMILVVSDGDGD